MMFMGYRRACGRAGTRNLVAVIPTVFCANFVARRIAESVRGACVFPHPVGCGYPGPDQRLTAHVLRRLAAHPNFGAVLLVGLGCERVRFEDVDKDVVGKPVHHLVIQEEGDSLKAIARGVAVAQSLAITLSAQEREPFPLSDLVLGLKCGGTDATSGLAAKPALGVASDMLIAAGGTSLLTEITELCGTEHIMVRRAASPEVADRIRACLQKNVQRLRRARAAAHASRGESLLVSPGNADGGVSNVVEKALGGLKKAGNAIFQDVIGYGEAPSGHGLYLMDGPGHDGEAVTGLVAAGASIVVFTTGRGTPAGFPGIPVIKATGNPALFASMGANMDFDAGGLFRERRHVEDIGRDLFQLLVRVASGQLTRAEAIGHDELFCVSRFVSTHRLVEDCGLLCAGREA